MSKIIFPKNFYWGAACASEQMEGKGNIEKGLTKWDIHFQEKPEDFFNGIGPDETSNFVNNYEESIKLWKEVTNINSIRISISWSRLFPKPNRLNDDAVIFYHHMFKTFRKNNIKIIVTLFHFDMPAWAAKRDGWKDRQVIDSFVKYAEFVFNEFGNEVEMFATFNEPVVPVFQGYLGNGEHYPYKYDPQLAFDYGNGMILAHAKVVNVFNSQKRKSKIGVVINVSPTHPRDKNNKEDIEGAKRFHLVHNAWMLDGMITGKFDKDTIAIFKELGAKSFNLSQQELKEISKIKLDFLGTNYYAPTRVKQYEGEEVNNDFEKLATPWKDPHARMNIHRGWEIFPEDIYNIAMTVKEKYNNIPFYISENGMGVENEERFRSKENNEIQDDYRIAFVQEHLEWVSKAIKDGANCFGYHMWTIEDNWSWKNAYKNRYGFFEYDLKTKKIIPKKSAHWFKRIIKDRGFDKNYIKLDQIKN